MRFLYFIFVFFISCSVLKKSPEVSISAPPDNVMIVIEEGQSVYVPVGDVLDSNDVTRFSDTLTTLATKSEIGTGGLDGFQNSNDSTVLSTPSMDYTIRRDIVTFDIPDSIQGTFPVGTLIRTRGFYSPGDGAGALYQVQATAPITAEDTIVIDLGTNYAVLQPINGEYDLRWFGAVGDDVTNNKGIPQKAAAYIAGNATLFIPRGKFIYDVPIETRINGLKIRGMGSSSSTVDGGYGSVLKYIGTGSAITTVAGIGSGQDRSSRIHLESFVIIGTDSAQHAINFDMFGIGNSLQSDRISKVRIEGFTNVGSYGIYLTRVYDMAIDNCRIWSSENGIYLGNEAVNITIDGTWIRAHHHGVNCDYAGLNSFNNGLIGYDGVPDSDQRAIFNSGELNVSNTHFEGNYIHIEATSAAKMVIENNKFNSSTIGNAILPNGSRIKLIGNLLPANSSITAGLGTEWFGNIEGTIARPSITADNPSGFATITNMDGSGGAFTLTTISSPNAVPNNPFTLYFLDDNVTINNVTSGHKILLKDGLPFKGYTGDRLVLQKRENVGGLITLEEIARIRHSDNYMQHRSTDYTLSRGDHELTFTNKEAVDTVTFILPNPISFDENMQYTFTKLDTDPMRIRTVGSPRRIRGASATSYLYLNHVGATVTLRLDSLFYEIVSSGGMYSFDSPDPGNAGGNFSGIGMEELRDSLDLVSYTNDEILVGDGVPINSTSPQFTINMSSPNSKRININESVEAYFYSGIAFEPNGLTAAASRRPSINGHLLQTRNTSNSAVEVNGLRFGGTYGTKTDVTNDTIPITSIHAYGWRGGSNRNVASIVLHGDKLFGSSVGMSGAIGFNTATGATFSRKMTLHRNGDLYLGVGLKSFGLETVSSKLLIRGDGTTTGNLFLAEDSNGDDKFVLQDNGTITLPVSPTLNNTADSVVVRNNVTGSLEVRSATSISGGFAAYTAQSSTYNVTASDNIIECTANSFTLNFPSAVGLAGKEWTVKNTGVGTITIEPDGAETIDGQSNTTLTTQYESITIFSNGTNLLIK